MNFGTKAETLERLESVLRQGKVLPQVRFTLAEWRSRSASILESVRGRSWLDLPLMVRSSSLNEDSTQASFAGRFLSIGNVTGEAALTEAIGKVGGSFGDGSEQDQIFIQPMLKKVSVSGVAFTCDPSNGGHYYVINYDERTGDSAAVTCGRSNDVSILYCDKTGDAMPAGPLAGLIPLLRELEELLGMDALDVEFAFTRDGILYLLQVRPLVRPVGRGLSRERHREVLAHIRRKVRQLSRPHPYLHGSRAVFGIMPDWNPAEIVGVRPRPLALSLYRQLVTDSIWAYQRDNYGYRNLRSFPLLTSFAGQPYIDVRVSFNSFVPRDLSPILAERLVNHYLEGLCQTPSHHDKVEFEIIHSCYTPDLPERLNSLLGHGFCQSDCRALAESLRTLTNNLIHRETGLWKTDIGKIAELDQRRRRILESGLDPVAKIYWLLEDCKRYGTLPFAGLARAAFIAVQFLKSLVNVAVLSAADYEKFMGSLDTVSSQMSADLANLSREAFLVKYGHLRPGTYDVLSPRYDEAPERYFTWPHPHAADAGDARPQFALSPAQVSRLEALLKEHRLCHDVPSLFDFMKSAIKGREYAKFVFTRSLSDAMSLLAGFAQGLELSRDEIAYADINVVYQLHGTSDDPAELLRQSIEAGLRNYEVTQAITLPPLITSEQDVSVFKLPHDEPNFITMKSCTGEVVQEEAPRDRLRAAVLMIPSADPGYDWIFSHGIGGFITKYGGANSHMAVRAAELGIPAVIGAGEVLFRRWMDAQVLEVDCANRQVRVLR